MSAHAASKWKARHQPVRSRHQAKTHRASPLVSKRRKYTQSMFERSGKWPSTSTSARKPTLNTVARAHAGAGGAVNPTTLAASTTPSSLHTLLDRGKASIHLAWLVTAVLILSVAAGYVCTVSVGMGASQPQPQSVFEMEARPLTYSVAPLRSSPQQHPRQQQRQILLKAKGAARLDSSDIYQTESDEL